MNREVKIKTTMLSLLITLCYGACTHLETDLKDFMTHRIVIPYDSLDYRICSLYKNDTVCNYKIKLVSLVEEEGCTACLIKDLSERERTFMGKTDYKDVEFVYIFRTTKETSKRLYSKLCNYRIEGTVYLDTCNAFLKANPHIPENELFHTFVINNDGKVLMVGNPFKNKKMEALLDKVISKEKKTFKK